MDKNNWTYKKLGEVASIKSGYTPSSSDLMDCGNIPYFKVGDMNNVGNEKYLQYSSSYVNDTFKSFPKGSIVFPKNGAAIATNKKRILKQLSVVDLNTAVLIPTQKENVEFLYYWISNIDFRDITRRGTVPTLDTKTLMKLDVPHPPLAEQERIVAELDLLSSIIEKKKVQLNELDQLAQSIFYDMFGDPITNEKGWEMDFLSNVCETVTDFVAAGSFADLRKNVEYIDVPDYAQLIRTVDLKNGFLKKAFVYVNKHAFDYLWRVNLDRDAIVLPNVGVNCGEVYYVTPSLLPYDNNVLGPNAILVRSNRENHIYLSFFFRSQYFNSQIKQITNAVGQPKFNKTELKKLYVILPPLPLQQEFASKIEAIERQKSLIQQSIVETQTLFDSRMDHWFG